jgi:hypothetical protein
VLVLLAFCFGCVAGSLTTQHWAKIRRAGGAALAVVAGTPPAPAAQNLKQAAPTIGTVLKNFGQFFGWCFRNWLPIFCVICVLVIIWGLMWLGDYFGLGKSKAEVRRDAQRNEQTLDARNETTIAGFEEGESFREDRRAIEDELARGNEALESIPSETSDLDFLRQWRDLDNGLLNAGSLAR